MQTVFRQAGRPAGSGPTWSALLVAVLFGTVAAAVLLLPVLYVLSALHLLPGGGITSAMSRGPGWPWPIHGWWPALADAGPMVGAAWVMAALVRSQLRRRTAGDLLLAPVIATSIGVGWLPVARPEGLVDVPFPLAFAAVLVVVRLCWMRTPLVPPGLTTTSRQSRLRRSARRMSPVAVGGLALAAASLTYHLLNPVRVETKSARHLRALPLSVVNDGPTRLRLLSVDPADAAGRALVRIDVPSRRTLAATMTELLSPTASEIAPGESRTVTATLAPANCGSRFAVTLNAVAVRVRIRWITRTQRVRLDTPLRLSCRRR